METVEQANSSTTSHRDEACFYAAISGSSNKAVLIECSAAWNGYLNALNTLCSAGNKLAVTIGKLEHGVLTEKTSNLATYLINSWKDLARATAVGTTTVKGHISAVLQDFCLPVVDEHGTTMCEKEQKRIRERSRLVALENVQTMINIQHQFCAASYNAFSSLTCCFVCQSPVGFPHEPDCTMINAKSYVDQHAQTPSPHCHSYKGDAHPPTPMLDPRVVNAPDQCYAKIEQRCSPPIYETIRGPLPNPGHLLSMKTPFGRGTISLLNYPLFPVNIQRRWSEAAAVETGDNAASDPETQMRRWSMPWEARKVDQNTVTWFQTRIIPSPKLSHSPDIQWQSPVSSQDGLTEAIQLLSCKPTIGHIVATPNLHQQSDAVNVD